MLEENRRQLADSMLMNSDWSARENGGVTNSWRDNMEHQQPQQQKQEKQQNECRTSPETTPRRAHVKLTRSQVTNGLGKRRKCDTGLYSST